SFCCQSAAGTPGRAATDRSAQTSVSRQGLSAQNEVQIPRLKAAGHWPADPHRHMRADSHCASTSHGSAVVFFVTLTKPVRVLRADPPGPPPTRVMSYAPGIGKPCVGASSDDFAVPSPKSHR